MKTFNEFMTEAFTDTFDFEQGPDESDAEYEKNVRYAKEVAKRFKVKAELGKRKGGVAEFTFTGDEAAVKKVIGELGSN